MTPALKRALWCRWFHRYRRHVHDRIISEDPSGSGVAFIIGGVSFGRTFCDACEDAPPRSRAYDRWCAS